MGASNFGQLENAKHYYAFGINTIGINTIEYEDIRKDIAMNRGIDIDDVNDDIVDEVIYNDQSNEYEDTIENIQYELKKHDFTIEDGYMGTRRDNKHIARDYIEFATRVKHWQTGKYVREYETLYCDVYVEPGYHDGARIDWTYSHDIQDITAKARKRINRINKKLDRICGEYTLKLKQEYKFSNGETGYSIVK